MAVEPLFSDVDAELRTTHEGEIIVREDAEAVNSELENLFMIAPGELVMDRRYGSDLSPLVGRSVNEGSAAFIRMAVQHTLEEEPRVRVERLQVTPRPDDAAYHVLLQYRLDSVYIRAVFERILSAG